MPTLSRSASSGAVIAAQTVASVGPYALISRRPPAKREMMSGGQASPATTSVRKPERELVGINPAKAGGSVA